MAEDEVEIMIEIDHQFLLGMECIFHDKKGFFIVCPVMEGGELSQFLKKNFKFSEEMVVFYAI